MLCPWSFVLDLDAWWGSQVRAVRTFDREEDRRLPVRKSRKPPVRIIDYRTKNALHDILLHKFADSAVRVYRISWGTVTHAEEEPGKSTIAVFWSQLMLGFGIKEADLIKRNAFFLHMFHDALRMRVCGCLGLWRHWRGLVKE